MIEIEVWSFPIYYRKKLKIGELLDLQHQKIKLKTLGEKNILILSLLKQNCVSDGFSTS